MSSVPKVILTGFNTGAEAVRNVGRIAREQEMYHTVMSKVAINPTTNRALPKALSVNLNTEPIEASSRKVLTATSDSFALDKNPKKISCADSDPKKPNPFEPEPDSDPDFEPEVAWGYGPAGCGGTA